MNLLKFVKEAMKFYLMMNRLQKLQYKKVNLDNVQTIKRSQISRANIVVVMIINTENVNIIKKSYSHLNHSLMWN